MKDNTFSQRVKRNSLKKGESSYGLQLLYCVSANLNIPVFLTSLSA